MNSVKLPWSAWYEETELSFDFPMDYQIDVYQIRQLPAIDQGQISAKLENLKNLLQLSIPKNIIIVVDDLTRPVILEPLLKDLLAKLRAFGVSNDKIKLLIGLGSHRPLSKTDMTKKIGAEIVEKYTCLNHNPDETVATGLQWGKTELKINKHYLSADFKIVISGLTPHSFAGFSGGAKMLIPGISDLEIISKTHKSVLMGFMGKLGEVENNRFRKVIEELVAQVGLDYFAGVLINGDRTIADIFTGDFKNAHRQAAAKAKKLYQTEINTDELYDSIILNAYPKDTELLQAENAFIPLKSANIPFVKEDGLIVVTSACSEGLGHHGLFGPGGLLYRKPRPLRFLKNKKLIFYTPNVSDQEFHSIFHSDYLLFREKERLINYLKSSLAKQAKIAVFPYASLQLVGS